MLASVLVINVDHDNGRAHFGQQESDTATDARAGAGDHGHLTGKREKPGGAVGDACGIVTHAAESSALPAASSVNSTSSSECASVTIECNAADGEA